MGSIHFIPGIYPYRVSLLTPIHFRVPSLISALWWPNNWAENGFSGTFWKNYWLNSFFSWTTPTCVAHDCKIENFIGYFWMRWVVIRAGVYCPHLWAQLVYSESSTILAWSISYLHFILINSLRKVCDRLSFFIPIWRNGHIILWQYLGSVS